MKVLVVDDSPDLRMLISRVIDRRSGGWHVVAQASDGREAVDAASEHDVDLVLLDIAMPVMDGLEALPLIREACPHATVIMLSGFGADEMVEKAMGFGAAGYIQKGQPMRELVSRVHALLSDDRGPGSIGGGGTPPGLLSRVLPTWRPAPGPRTALGQV